MDVEIHIRSRLKVETIGRQLNWMYIPFVFYICHFMYFGCYFPRSYTPIISAAKKMSSILPHTYRHLIRRCSANWSMSTVPPSMWFKKKSHWNVRMHSAVADVSTGSLNRWRLYWMRPTRQSIGVVSMVHWTMRAWIMSTVILVKKHNWSLCRRQRACRVLALQ